MFYVRLSSVKNKFVLCNNTENRTEKDKWMSTELCYPSLMEVTQGFMLDFTDQSGALCLQVEGLTGSLVDAVFDMANDHHCLSLALKAL